MGAFVGAAGAGRRVEGGGVCGAGDVRPERPVPVRVWQEVQKVLRPEVMPHIVVSCLCALWAPLHTRPQFSAAQSQQRRDAYMPHGTT